MKQFLDKIMKKKNQVFSVDLLRSEDKKTCDIVVQFNNGKQIRETFKNNWYTLRGYNIIRRNCLSIKV